MQCPRLHSVAQTPRRIRDGFSKIKSCLCNDELCGSRGALAYSRANLSVHYSHALSDKGQDRGPFYMKLWLVQWLILFRSI